MNYSEFKNEEWNRSEDVSGMGSFFSLYDQGKYEELYDESFCQYRPEFIQIAEMYKEKIKKVAFNMWRSLGADLEELERLCSWLAKIHGPRYLENKSLSVDHKMRLLHSGMERGGGQFSRRRYFYEYGNSINNDALMNFCNAAPATTLSGDENVIRVKFFELIKDFETFNHIQGYSSSLFAITRRYIATKAFLNNPVVIDLQEQKRELALHNLNTGTNSGRGFSGNRFRFNRYEDVSGHVFNREAGRSQAWVTIPVKDEYLDLCLEHPFLASTPLTFKGKKAFLYDITPVDEGDIKKAAKNLKHSNATEIVAFSINKGFWLKDSRAYKSYYASARHKDAVPQTEGLVGSYVARVNTSQYSFTTVSTTLGRAVSSLNKQIENQVMRQITSL